MGIRIRGGSEVVLASRLSDPAKLRTTGDTEGHRESHIGLFAAEGVYGILPGGFAGWNRYRQQGWKE